MRKSCVPCSLTVVTLLVMTSALCAGRTVIDLTYPLKQGEDVSWPIFPRYNFTIMQRGPGHGDRSRFWLEYNNIELAEHTGTHLDAPAHFIKDHWRMQKIPPSRFIGPGVLVDVSEKVKANVDYAVSVDDLKAWESQHGTIPDGAVVLMYSGWGRHYPDRKRIFNPASGDPTDTTSFHFPAFSVEAAQWLIDNRDVTAVGVDTPTPDQGLPFATHLALLDNYVLILENVANLDKMPAAGTTVVIGGINIFDGSGAPARILAFVEGESSDSHNAARGDLIGRFSAVLLLAVVTMATVCISAIS